MCVLEVAFNGAPKKYIRKINDFEIVLRGKTG